MTPEDPEFRAEYAASRIDVERLARALVKSGLMARYGQYAVEAHPETMERDSDEETALSWAPDIAAAYSEASAEPKDRG